MDIWVIVLVVAVVIAEVFSVYVSVKQHKATGHFLREHRQLLDSSRQVLNILKKQNEAEREMLGRNQKLNAVMENELNIWRSKRTAMEKQVTDHALDAAIEIVNVPEKRGV